MTKIKPQRYFWREKNANSFIGKCKVLGLTQSELFEEIIKKFYEKLDMINVIFNKTKREEYLYKKNKIITENTPEIEIRQRIGTRVIIDFLQLIKDLCDLKHIKLKAASSESGKNKDEIYLAISGAISNIKSNTEDSLLTIYKNILNLIDLLLLNYMDIEIERQKVEEKEGSFYNGKIVVK